MRIQLWARHWYTSECTVCSDAYRSLVWVIEALNKLNNR